LILTEFELTLAHVFFLWELLLGKVFEPVTEPTTSEMQPEQPGS
jgi:hypothetical protein